MSIEAYKIIYGLNILVFIIFIIKSHLVREANNEKFLFCYVAIFIQ